MPALLTVLVNSKFDGDPIKNECAGLETPFSHYKSMGNFFPMFKGTLNSEGSGLIWTKFELVQDFTPVLIICKFDKDRIKTEGVIVETSFSQK